MKSRYSNIFERYSNIFERYTAYLCIQRLPARFRSSANADTKMSGVFNINALLEQVDSLVFALAEQAELALNAAVRACLRQRETEEELEAATVHEGLLAAESDELRTELISTQAALAQQELLTASLQAQLHASAVQASQAQRHEQRRVSLNL